MLSIVIPTLNAGNELPATLGCLAAAALPSEVIVVDGGSSDATATVAAEAGARVVFAGGGRGPQLAAGAEAATGDWLLFLHADTRPQPGWEHAVTTFTSRDGNRFRAAHFAFILDDPAPAARRLESFVHWRCRALGLPYGDQGLLIGRQFYDALGGFQPLPIMEDVDMARRIGRRRLDVLPAAAVTSAERYRREGYWLRPARNALCVALYLVGVPARVVNGLYG